jgi:hypothetical protein
VIDGVAGGVRASFGRSLSYGCAWICTVKTAITRMGVTSINNKMKIRRIVLEVSSFILLPYQDNRSWLVLTLLII